MAKRVSRTFVGGPLGTRSEGGSAIHYVLCNEGTANLFTHKRGM